ncbi:ABC transporter ATP-binding protein [Thermoflexus hugenholtzii]
MSLLRAEGLSKSYAIRGRRVPVLRQVSLEVPEGRVLAVLGPSGAGKSTLLRLLAGLESPDEGEVRLRGNPVRAGHPELALMFQDPCLLPWLSVRENVRFGIRFLGLSGAESRRRVEEALAWVGLREVADWYPHQLSGGMAQRVALARALARQPRVLLLDEPFSALDAPTRQALGELIRRVAGEGIGVVLVTHDVEEAIRLADEVMILTARPGQVLLHRPLREWEAPHTALRQALELASVHRGASYYGPAFRFIAG